MNNAELHELIAERAEDDGSYAIAFAILQCATHLKYLGTGDAATAMGAIEYLASHLGDKLTDAAAIIAEGMPQP